MVKMIFLLTKKPGMTRDAFIERYETQHAPYALKLVPYMAEYRRTYLPEEGMLAVAHAGPAADRPQFDVVMELWFNDQSALDEMFSDVANTNKGQLIAEDEMDQFDRKKMMMMVVDEYVTPADRLMPKPDGVDRPAVKMVCFVRRHPSLSREEFIERYETVHAELAMKILTDDQGRCVFGEYRRSFPQPDTMTQFGEEGAPAWGYQFDGMTEIGFWTEADFYRFHECTQMESVSVPLSADELQTFDMQFTTMFIGEEHITTPEQCASALKALREREAA